LIKVYNSKIFLVDSNSFLAHGAKENNDFNLISFRKSRYSFIPQKTKDFNVFPFDFCSFKGYEKTTMVIREQSGLQTPYNTLLISRDTGKTYFEFTWNDASNIDVLLVYENMVFIEYSDSKSKKHYVLTTDTFKTFTELDWQQPYIEGKRTFFKKGNFWRVGKQMGSNANKKSFGPNAEYFESKDNGLSWKKVTLPVKYNFEMLSPDTFYTASRSKVYWSYNAGQTWDSLSHNMPAKRVSDIWFANVDTGFAIMDGKRLYKTIDGGFKWDLAYLFDCSTFYIDPWDENYILFHSINQAESNKENLCIYRTTNGVSNPVGMQEFEIPNGENGNKEDFTLYPNPANQSITLSTPNGQNAQLSIFNLMGQLQYQNPNQAPGNIDISQLATGLYIFELRQGNQVHRHRVEIVK
jgi:hypothetical protein